MTASKPGSRPTPALDDGSGMPSFDWVVIGSGFGGSVAALRLAEKGYRVAVLERGRRFNDEDFARTTWDLKRFLWAPWLGLRGILRMSVFKDVFIASGSGVGGGSLVFANTLYRAKPAFFTHHQWPATSDWSKVLQPHYETAEHMLGAQRVPHDSDSQRLLRDMATHFGAEDTFTRTTCSVFFGAPGVTVADPYFGGLGPARTGCLRCGACMVGCRTGAKNTLVKNYLWLAERLGVEIFAEREVCDVRPVGAPDGTDGYIVETRRAGAVLRPRRQLFRAAGVVVAAGALGTNALLARCKLSGSLPALSERLGHLVRTNSESLLAVTLPDERLAPWNDVAISASFHPDADTHIEFVTYGEHGDFLSGLTTLLTDRGTRVTRPLKFLATVVRHPVMFARTLWPFGWSRRTLILLVMQSLDNALRFRARKRWFGRGVRLSTEQDEGRPNPTYIEAGDRAARWLARRTGGLPQSMVVEALANIPATAHILGGAVIGRDASCGVVDDRGRAFGYRNLLVCDGSVVPANPGVNPSLTITALAEHAMSRVPARGAATPAPSA
jgi:cholesterol oxidase